MKYRQRAIALVATSLGLAAAVTAGCSQAPQETPQKQTAPPAPQAPSSPAESTSDTEGSTTSTAQKRIPELGNGGVLVVNLQKYDAANDMVELIVPAPGEYNSGDWSEDPSNPGDFFVPLADEVEVTGSQKVCSGTCGKDELIAALQRGAIYVEISLNSEDEINSMVEMPA
ncbi:hypothetical protein ABT337_00810 [Saccharopolyspora hirsuta]|uniref:hypothetical protein n=1 Tax=Saccharopolyspora hirsuta TaxID=1837 RepID=UPI003333266A